LIKHFQNLEESRNLRLRLVIDYMNPYENLSSKHNSCQFCWWFTICLHSWAWRENILYCL